MLTVLQIAIKKHNQIGNQTKTDDTHFRASTTDIEGATKRCNSSQKRRSSIVSRAPGGTLETSVLERTQNVFK